MISLEKQLAASVELVELRKLVPLLKLAVESWKKSTALWMGKYTDERIANAQLEDEINTLRRELALFDDPETAS